MTDIQENDPKGGRESCKASLMTRPSDNISNNVQIMNEIIVLIDIVTTCLLLLYTFRR